MASAPISTPRRGRVALASAACLAVMALALGACGSSKKTTESADTTAAVTPSSEGASASSTPATTGSGTASGLPDPCSLLTTDEVNGVLKGADAGKQQLSQCVWTDGEGTAARLVISQPKAGTALDTSTGKTLSGVGEVAVISTAPGSVKISARANGYQIDFSVDTGTSDIKPNQDNAVALVKTAIGNLP